MAEPARVLVELGLHNATLDTVEVSRLLQEEVAQASEVLTYPTVQAGLLTMQVRSEARIHFQMQEGTYISISRLRPA